MPAWLQTILGPGVLVAVVTVVGSILTARAGREATLPEHFDRELKRLSDELDKAWARIERLEARDRALNDHIDALEQHIWQKLPPPPPKRPSISSIGSPNDR